MLRAGTCRVLLEMAKVIVCRLHIRPIDRAYSCDFGYLHWLSALGITARKHFPYHYIRQKALIKVDFSSHERKRAAVNGGY